MVSGNRWVHGGLLEGDEGSEVRKCEGGVRDREVGGSNPPAPTDWNWEHHGWGICLPAMPEVGKLMEVGVANL